MMLTHTDYRGTTNWDRSHRHANDKGLAAASAGLTVIRLEVASCNALRRKPWGKDGNQNIMKLLTHEFFETYDWDSEMFALWYPWLCQDFDELGIDLFTDEHIQKVHRLAKKKLLSAGIMSEAKNS